MIENINKFFIWEFTVKTLSNNDILKTRQVRQLPLYEVLDYLSICKQESNVQKMKESKNILAL